MPAIMSATQVVIFGITHGLILLPVVLAIWGRVVAAVPVLDTDVPQTHDDSGKHEFDRYGMSMFLNSSGGIWSDHGDDENWYRDGGFQIRKKAKVVDEQRPNEQPPNEQPLGGCSCSDDNTPKPRRRDK